MPLGLTCIKILLFERWGLLLESGFEERQRSVPFRRQVRYFSYGQFGIESGFCDENVEATHVVHGL
jgi:hypothetical protein